MASTVIIPFNNNPSTISVKTSSYTVPAGKYAYLVNESPNIQINGTNLYQSFLQNFAHGTTEERDYFGYCNAVYVTGNLVNLGNTSGSGGVAFSTVLRDAQITTAPNVRPRYKPIVSASAGPSVTTAFTPTFSNSGGELIFWTVQTGGGAGMRVDATVFCMNHTPYGIWVPSGTVINSARFTIIEYNV